MFRRQFPASGLLLGAMLGLPLALAATQERPLSVVSASPRDALDELIDANEIRISFSEAMVPVGQPDVTVPAWLTLEPALRVATYWSGTRTLIVSPDPAHPLPYGTRVRVHVGAGARSLAGREMREPFAFEFTTPTARLLGADYYRPEGLVTEPAIIRLRFNQPMDARAVLSSLTVRTEPQDWRPPLLSPDERRQWSEAAPEGLARFDAKVARVHRLSRSSLPVAVRLATEWDRDRFPPDPAVVVVETVTPPEPGAHLNVGLDGALVGATGTVPHTAQSTVMQMEPALFVRPGWPVAFTRAVRPSVLRASLSISDRTNPSAAVPVPLESTAQQHDYESSYHHPSVVGVPRQPAMRVWQIRLNADLRSTDGQTLGYEWAGTSITGRDEPYFGWEGAIWESAAGTVVPYAARNITHVWEGIEPVEMARIPGLLEAGLQANPPRPGAGVERSLHSVADAHEVHGLDLSRIFRGRSTGLAWAHLTATAIHPDAPVRAIFDYPHRPMLLQVTNLALSVKDSRQSTVLFVTSLDRAEPIAQANVSLRDSNGDIVWTGVTDGDGIARAPGLPQRTIGNSWTPQWIAAAEKDGDVTWIASHWGHDVSPAAFGFPVNASEAGRVVRGGIFTDRGVYLPGETVTVRAMLRYDDPTGYSAAPEGTVFTVALNDPRGRQIASSDLTVNRWSSAEWRVRIPVGAPLGHYYVFVGQPRANRGDTEWPRSVSRSFQVAEFRRPDFRVDVAATAEAPILGERLRGTIDARFLFGAPLGTQPVRWTVRQSPVHDIPAQIHDRFSAREFAFGHVTSYDDGRSAQIPPIQERTTLDSNGRATVDIPVARGTDARAVTLEAEVRGLSGQFIANRSSVTFHPAALYVGLVRPPFLIDAQKGLETAVVAAMLDGSPRAGVSVDVTLLKEDWRQPTTRNDTSRWTRVETEVERVVVATTSDRVPVRMPLPTGGRYILRATATDDAGRETRTDVSFYAYGGGATRWNFNGPRLELIPERPTWRPGEHARILVPSPWPLATALVTTEREGVRSVRRVSLTSTQDTITVPITSADIPNVYVSVIVLKGRTDEAPTMDDADPGRPSYRVGYTELQVDDTEKRLAVQVRADRESYRPRDTVRVAVDVARSDGRRGPTEVTLWAVDHGVLSLTDYTLPDLARSVFVRKSVLVYTQDSRARIIGRRPLTKPLPANAGGPPGIPAPPPPAPPAPMLMESTLAGVEVTSSVAMTESVAVLDQPNRARPSEPVRSDFRSLAFWVGSLTTDASGRAETRVTLPDSLTTYRVMAVAGDPASHFGAGFSEIRATKPLTLVPAFPRFLIVGNRASFGAVVTNGSSDGGMAEVSIENLTSHGVTFEGQKVQTMRLGPGQSVPVRFDARAGTEGVARLRLRVRLGAESDAFELALPVRSASAPITVAAYGDTTAVATEGLVLPPAFVPGRGGLTVAVASTALVGLNESARYLDDIEYECAEPLASKALALMLSAELDGAFGGNRRTAEATRQASIETLQALREYQCMDGGFGMFRSHCQSSPYVTAYILHVLRATGTIDGLERETAQRALGYLQSRLRDRPPEAQWWPAWAATQAFMVKVLAEANRRVPSEISALVAVADRMPRFALSYLADALVASGDRSGRYDDVIRRLTNATRVEADRAFIEETDDASLAWLWNTNVRATAVVLEGFARRGEHVDLSRAMARWLLAARINGRWSTTQDNGAALLAIVNYYRAFEQDTPDMRVTTKTGTRVIGTATFKGRSTSAREFIVPLDQLRAGAGGDPSGLTIERTGQGRVHYTTRLTYVPIGLPTPVMRGLRLSRRYERITNDGAATETTSFERGDLVRVTVRIALTHEGRFLVITDPLPAGLEAVDGALATTAQDLARVSTTQSSDANWLDWWRRGGFAHVERRDDRVVAQATRLSQGSHEITYLARAMTSGTFDTPGTLAEAIYTPEISGRGAPATIVIR